MRASDISTTRSSSARPTMSARFPSSRTSFRVTTSPFRSVSRARTTLNDSLRTTSWPFWSSAASIWGWSDDPHLPAGGEDVDAAVLVGGEVRAVARRRHRQLLDLLPEGGDVLPRLAEGGRQLLVLRQRLGELALRLEEPLLQGPDPLRGVLEPPAEADDLLLQRLELALEIGDFPLVFLETLFVLGGRGDHLLSPGSPTRGPVGRGYTRRMVRSGCSSESNCDFSGKGRLN